MSFPTHHLQTLPIHAAPRLYQVVNVDDLVQPRTEKMLFAALGSYPWLHRKAFSAFTGNTESHRS